MLTFAWLLVQSYWKGLCEWLEEPEICKTICYWWKGFGLNFSFWREGAKPTLQITSVWECFCVLTVRIDFVRKCKQAGLLDDIFEEMLDTLHLAQEKLMDDNTSETGMFHGHPWQGLCCQSRGADLNPRHLALGHLPENTMVLNNSVLISAAVQEVENDLPFWMTTYNESSKKLLSQNYVRAANSASLVRPSDLNFRGYFYMLA